jgi:hypothetical protein
VYWLLFCVMHRLTKTSTPLHRSLPGTKVQRYPTECGCHPNRSCSFPPVAQTLGRNSATTTLHAPYHSIASVVSDLDPKLFFCL